MQLPSNSDSSVYRADSENLFKSLNCLRYITLKALLYVSLATAALADGNHEPIGEAIKDVPIFDAHIHYKEQAWGPYPPSTVIEMMDRNGVAMGLVSSTPDEGTIKLWQHAPNRVVPELRPYRDNAGSSNWTKAPGMAEYIRDRLEAYPHEGIGEFHIRRIDPADEPLLKEIARMAKERGILIHIHSDAEPVHLLYRLEPSLTIIWAHAGMVEPPDVITTMFETYPTLYADTSYREMDILTPEGGIEPEWRVLIEKFPERLMVGSDTWINWQWAAYDTLISRNRKWLSNLPRETAEMIAYKNAEKLFGRKVSNKLIGRR